MLLAVAGLVGASFTLVSLLVGGRLLGLGLRSHRTPELLVGFGLFAMGGLACPLQVVGQQVTALGDGVRAACAFAAMLLLGAGLTSLAAFTWRVFRPQQGWAQALVAGIGLVFAVCALGQAVQPGYRAIAVGGHLPWLLHRLATTACLAWCGGESLAYARVSARRQRIGLSDPAVTNRFVLWAGSTLTCTLLTVVTGLLDPSLSNSLVGVVVTAPIALAAAVGLWFAFLPPLSYTRWLLQRRPA